MIPKVSKVALMLVLVTPLSARARMLNVPRDWQWPPSQAMLDEGAQCLRHLDALGVKFEAGPATKWVTTPVLIPDMTLGELELTPTFEKPPFVMDCELAEVLAMGAPALRALGIRELRFAEIYDDRTVAGQDFLSRHALGLAIDVYELVTDDGISHVVAKDYAHGDPVLLAAEKALAGAGIFRGPLTPGNDPAHHGDHFHIEARTVAERRPPEGSSPGK
jgi:hypothetical protein